MNKVQRYMLILLFKKIFNRFRSKTYEHLLPNLWQNFLNMVHLKIIQHKILAAARVTS